MLRFRESELRTTTWPNGKAIRYFCTGDGILLIASDVCRANRLHLNSIGIPNVSRAIANLANSEKCAAMLEDCPREDDPYTSYALITLSGAKQLVHLSESLLAAPLLSKKDLSEWIERLQSECPPIDRTDQSAPAHQCKARSSN